jgi:hypothetical protein
MKLRQCFDKYGCDRGSKRHRYDRIYEGIQPKRILEIGVFKGAGISAWLDYCDAEIVCVDLFERCDRPAIMEHPRVTWVKADSTTVNLSGAFDLIIDDGAHDPDSQRLTFQNLFKRCSGQYFIEDVWALDIFNAQELRHPWIQKPEYSMEKYCKLLHAVSAHDLTCHDLREGHAPDSYLFEIKR